MKTASCPFPRNARFWETTQNCGLVKITLRPGQSLTHYRHSRHDEGHSWHAETYTHEGDHVSNQWGHGGRDCDGTHRTTGEHFAALSQLAAAEIYHHPGTLRPDWKEARPAACFDQFAAASNY